MTPRANFTPDQVAEYCRIYGPQTGPLPPGVEGQQLLWAMSDVESKHGTNCQPRYEAAYDAGGRYGAHAPMPALRKLYGKDAACSYGPLQCLLCNAGGLAPQDFDSIDIAFHASVVYLNWLLRHFQPANLDEIGECWNAGHKTPDPAYTAKLRAAYAVPLPEVSG